MLIVDLNVPLYVVNEDSPHHRATKAWWASAVAGDESIGFAWVVVSGFIRLATNPRIFERPLAVERALETVESWLDYPTATIIREKEDHWDTFKSLISECGTAGNLTTDAHLATLAICHGAVLVSCDNDFARFPKLRWMNPAA